jgi:hypothetical protein
MEGKERRRGGEVRVRPELISSSGGGDLVEEGAYLGQLDEPVEVFSYC